VAHDQCAMKVGTDGVLLGAWCNVSDDRNILDIGSGSGVVALMLAQRNPTAKISAVEIDKSSATQCARNFTRSPWADRLKVIHAPVQALDNRLDHSFDHIVSNPPFFAEDHSYEIHDAVRRSARTDTHLSLDELFLHASRMLSKNGKVSIIIPVARKHAAIQCAASCDLYPYSVTNVLPKAIKACHRVLISFTDHSIEIREDQLIIQKSDERNDFTEDYIDLTREFHTIL